MFGQTIEAAAAAEEAAAAVKGALSAAVALLLVVVVEDDGVAILPLAGTTTCRRCLFSGRIHDDADRTGTMAFYNCTAADGNALTAAEAAIAAR